MNWKKNILQKLALSNYAGGTFWWMRSSIQEFGKSCKLITFTCICIKCAQFTYLREFSVVRVKNRYKKVSYIILTEFRLFSFFSTTFSDREGSQGDFDLKIEFCECENTYLFVSYNFQLDFSFSIFFSIFSLTSQPNGTQILISTTNSNSARSKIKYGFVKCKKKLCDNQFCGRWEIGKNLMIFWW